MALFRRQQRARATENGDHARADALDVLIEQERQMIAYYEARQASADAMAGAALTAVLALAALTATAVKTIEGFDTIFAWLVAAALVLACVAAVIVRSLAGLRRTPTSLLTTSSEEIAAALNRLRDCGPANLDPVEVRQRTLTLCRERARVAHEAARSKARWAAAASAALAVSVTLTAILALTA